MAPRKKKDTTTAKKTTSKTDSKKSVLLKELRSLIKDIDEEGLFYLIEQANVLKYNMQVDKINNELAKVSSQQKQVTKNKSQSVSKEVMITGDAKHDDFMLQIGNQRKVLTLDEMRAITKIAHGGTLLEASGRLYNWFKRERSDILMDCGIRTVKDSVLSDIVTLIKSKYKVK